MKLVTISESHNSTDLAVLKSKLESEGIKCFLKDELSSQVLTHISSMVVKLQVYESDFSKAKAIMQATGQYPFTKQKTITCPYCNSSKVKLDSKPGNIIKFYFRYFTNQLLMKNSKNLAKGITFICLSCNKTFVAN